MGIKSNYPAAYFYDVFSATGTDASEPATQPFSATGGDVVTSPYPDSSATYKCHIFINPGTFVVTGDPKDVEFFIVGGGGGSGTTYSGGGGAGGLRSSMTGVSPGGPGTSVESALNVGPGTHTVTVGGGGDGAPAGGDNNRGNSGANSVFSTIIAQGGG